jgi:formate C-acetyltransferase
MDRVKVGIEESCAKIHNRINSLFVAPSPFMDVLRKGKKYNNFGIHGCGVAPAADALAAVKRFVYDEGRVAPEELLRALDNDFADSPELLHTLRYEAPKMGADGGELASEMASAIMNMFADANEGKKNCLGGIWRCGTGTAMFYLWHANALGATADGRRAGEPFGTNFSPSIFTRIAGPVSVVEAFAPKEIARNMNGGPLTLEFASSVFGSEESISKVADLIRYFISLGGHQLQLNAVSLDKMKKAQQNPELYKQLVVRIWGWSAYFVELDKCFQDHVMLRQEYSV